MKCRAVYAWLLEARDVAALPAEVQRHLQACRECGQRLQQLQQIDEEIQGLPFPPETPGVRERFLQHLPERRPAPVPASPAPAAFGWRSLVFVAAACLLLGLALGRLLGPHTRSTAPSTDASPNLVKDRPHDGPPSLVVDLQEKEHRPEPVRLEPLPRDEDVVSRVVHHDVRLAASTGPGEKVRILGELAGDLQDEALRTVRSGRLEQLPVVAELHEQVVRHGLTRRARAVSIGDRPAVLPGIEERLHAGAKTLRQAAGSLQPAVGDFLRSMSAACAEVAAVLEKNELPEPPATPAPQPAQAAPTLLASLVYGGLDLAELDDPLQRADRCTDVADALVRSILLSHDSEQASRLGTHLGTVLDRGVADNLARASTAGLDEKRTAELEKVRRRAERATTALEANLDRAPAPARQGLERAMEASEEGRERAAAAGSKHKGKPKARKGKTRGPHPIPPGQMKKLLNQSNP